MNNTIRSIQQQFISEANNSPILFQDLANMEKYISESYSGRSLIELLQNADDANASNFYLERMSKDVYIIANDGRYFTNEDLLSLCRSGASTKTRNRGTIGFRGIGFKSVVNYAEEVHILSGDIKCTFSRELTKKISDDLSDVPLIRIPHPFQKTEFATKIATLEANGYHTIFIFSVNNSMLDTEVAELKNDCMIFLQSVDKIQLNLNNQVSFTRTTETVDSRFDIIALCDANKGSNWLVTKPKTNNQCAIAFKMANNKAFPAGMEESVVHSFMPTTTTLSIPIKINGNFSTDPSRTKVVLDNESIAAGKSCSALLLELIDDVFTKNADVFGIIDVLRNAKVDPLRSIRGEGLNEIIVDYLKLGVGKIFSDLNGKVYLQPDGITNEDFSQLANHLNIKGIGRDNEVSIPGLIDFLRAMDIDDLPIEDCLTAMKEIVCSEKTRISILSNVIASSRAGISPEKKVAIANAKLFDFSSGVKSIKDNDGSEKVDGNFENCVLENISSVADYSSFAKKVGLSEKQLAISDNLIKNHSIVGTNIEKKTQNFATKRTIRKWRSVEKNVAALLELVDNICSVEDVSKQNLGYDLEATTTNGDKRFYEVKSVDHMGGSFSITTNEYSTGAQHQNNFYLAIACQTDSDIEVCLINDPINRLLFNKRVVRWEWTCDDYGGDIISGNLGQPH